MREGTGAREIAVIGAGVVGCATAFACARAGYSVTLVERDGIAAHASGSNAGNLNPLHGTPPAQRALALEAFGLHRELHAALRAMGCDDYALAPVRRVHLGFDEADRAALQEVIDSHAGVSGFAAAWLDLPALRRSEPRLAPDLRFAVRSEGSLSVSGAGLCRSLAQGAVRLGARLVTATVTGIATQGGRASAVQTADGAIACDALVLATGPWAARTGEWLGLDAGITPVQGQMLRIRLAGGPPAHDLTWRTAALYSRHPNELWVGGTMERRGFDTSPDEAAKSLLLAQAARILPAAAQAGVLAHTVALRPVPATGDIVAGAAPGWRNVYLANGGGTKGLLLSAVIASRVRAALEAG